jgi:diguanylate cyclase (GGDEF)-like protein
LRVRRLASRALGVLVALHLQPAVANSPVDADELLRTAEHVKTSNYAEFLKTLDALDGAAASLSPLQREYVRYHRAWQIAYEGDYATAIPMLEGVVQAGASDRTLQLKTRAAMVNLLSLAKRYEQAFVQLRALVDLLPDVADPAAREQALGVTSLLYNQVGQYDSGLAYAQKLAQEGASPKAQCTSRQLQLEALYRSGALKTAALEFQSGIDACVKAAEPVFANIVRTVLARIHIDQRRHDEAIALLGAHYEEARATRYARLIAEFESLLATAYRETGNAALAHQHALRAIEYGVQNHYTEPLVTAYRLLYVLAKERGDARLALAYHEKYAAADKGYLDDVSARQLAYQRVNHDAIADKLRIDALNKENEVLQLQRALDKKKVETSSLYIALLILVIVTIAFWAYRTKRSQLHFMRLSQIDGLTGIANRPRFIDLAQSALENARKSGQDVCVVLCDLDHFKSINDEHGHAAGDFVLKQTVAACQMHMRTSDIFGRFGGEEFGIVLPGCSLDDARQRAEQLRLAIAAISGNYEGVELSVSASFGVAASAATGFELRQLLAQADAALYRAKHAGRNCVVAADARGAEPSASAGSRYGFGEGAADAMARIF